LPRTVPDRLPHHRLTCSASQTTDMPEDEVGSSEAGTGPADLETRVDSLHEALNAVRETDKLVAEYVQTRNLALFDELVLGYERLVHFIANRFAPSEAQTRVDVVEVAYVGLIYALEQYDPASGVAFVTFATPTIMGYMKHHLRKPD